MKQFVVIGLGQFGQSVARTLAKEGAEVIAIDSDDKPIELIKNGVTLAVQLDATNQVDLRKLNLDTIDAGIVAIGERNYDDSVMATMNLRELGVPLIVVRATSPVHGSILSKMGANRIVFPETSAGEQIAINLLSDNVLEQIPLFSKYSLAKIRAGEIYWGKKIIESKIRQEFDLLIVGIERNIPEVRDDGSMTMRSSIIGLPLATEIISEGDNLLVVGEDVDINRFVISTKEDN